MNEAAIFPMLPMGSSILLHIVAIGVFTFALIQWRSCKKQLVELLGRLVKAEYQLAHPNEQMQQAQSFCDEVFGILIEERARGEKLLKDLAEERERVGRVLLESIPKSKE